MANVKAAGEFAELVFMVKASSLGLAISKPYGDNQVFDFHVSGKAGTFRVQVKSAWSGRDGRYTSLVHPRMARSLRQIDFVVVYVPPLDSWYVIPAKNVKRGTLRVYPHNPKSRAAYEKYRNAWHLLTGDPADDSWTLGLTIHAAAE